MSNYAIWVGTFKGIWYDKNTVSVDYCGVVGGECGVSITNLQTLMGHQSISTTALYINENPKILGKISEDFSFWRYSQLHKETPKPLGVV